MNEQLLLDTLTRFEDKVDAVAEDVKAIQIEMAELRGIRRAALYIASTLGAAGGGVAAFFGHRLGAW